ncbi:hypothetical protein, partial [Paraburkholderia unamae]|uniref:hypothetical protein n=1 Tax=Paraburkholderia unamae TaxID=219649 RepID=UPI001AD833B5
HATCLRLGLTQLRSQPGITGGPFCAFLHGLGRNPPVDAYQRDVRPSTRKRRSSAPVFAGANA